MQADHPLGLGPLQPALGKEQQAQGQTAKRRRPHPMGNGLQLQRPHQPTPGDANSTGRGDWRRNQATEAATSAVVRATEG